MKKDIQIRDFGNRNLWRAILDELERIGYNKHTGRWGTFCQGGSYVCPCTDGDFCALFYGEDYRKTITFDELVALRIEHEKKVPEYTMEEAISLVGHNFKIKK